MRRPTISELQDKIQTLEATVEAFIALRDPERWGQAILVSGYDDRKHEIEVLGYKRASGGVVVVGPCVSWAGEWVARAQRSGDAYLDDLARKVTQLQEDAIK